jgi:hypothetical protein
MSKGMPQRSIGLKLWLINCELHVTQDLLARDGLQTLLNANLDSNRVLLDRGIARESFAATKGPLGPSSTWYRTLRPSAASRTKIPTTLARLASL